MRTSTWLLLAAALGIGLGPAPVRADEIADQIREGLKNYESGSYAEAIGSLNFAVAQIQEKQAGRLKEAFPPPLDGWKAEEASGQFAGAAMMGGGISASRHYYRDDADASVDIEIVTDSPLLQSMAMFLTNPALMAGQPGSKLVRIKGNKGLQKFSAEDRSGEITVMIQSRMLVTVRGSGMDKPDALTAYANALDYAALEKYLAQ